MFSDSESILTDEVLQGIKQDKIPTFNAELIKEDLEEASMFLNMFKKGLSRANTNIVESMVRYMPGALSMIFGIHKHIVFKDNFKISPIQLFTILLPPEYGKFVESIQRQALDNQKALDTAKKENEKALDTAKKENEKALEVLNKKNKKALEKAKQEYEKALDFAEKEKDIALDLAKKEKDTAVAIAKKVNKKALKIAIKENEKLKAELELLKATTSQKITELETKCLSSEEKWIVACEKNDDFQTKSLAFEQILKVESEKVIILTKEIETFRAKELDANDLLKDKDQQIAELQLQIKGQLIQVNPIPTRPWDFEQIVTKAFNNKGQKVGDKSQLWDGSDSFKQFDSLQALMQTLPRPQAFRTFFECIAKHPIFLPCALPAHIDLSTYSFDWNSAVFNGPFDNGNGVLLIEQQQTDRPLFMIVWDPNDSEYLTVNFFNPSDKSKQLYYVYINASEAWLDDETTGKTLYHYYVNSDGSLGSQIED